MPDRAVDADSLSDLRSALAADVASLAGTSLSRGQHRARYEEPSGPASIGATDVQVTVNLNSGVVLLDDERRMRLLAREIKRLIIEDVRRGIGI